MISEAGYIWMILDMASCAFLMSGDRVPAIADRRRACVRCCDRLLNLVAMEPANSPIVVTRFICAISVVSGAISPLLFRALEFRDVNVGPE